VPAVDELYRLPDSALKAVEPFAPTWYWMTSWPDMNTALPEAEMQVKMVWPFCDASRSPMRPPQPSRAPSPTGWFACHTDCWSLCEKSFGGSGTERPRYCASVVGMTSGPTLATTASLPRS
jgi:hypothetical protein